jgi:hypothetical protein
MVSPSVRLLLLLVLALAPLARPGAQAPSRVVVVGDVHGDYTGFVRVLTDAGVIDKRRRWIGGDTVLVQTGDVLDRGPDSRKVMDLLIELEKQAPKAGGRVHALLGNHEVMNLTGDLRYVTPAEYASYRSLEAESLRERVYAASADPLQRQLAEYREAWMAEHPLGWVELQQAFLPRGKYGKWLRAHDVVTRVGDTLFLHGGIAPAYATLTVDTINRRARAALASTTPLGEPILADEQGPLWYRGLALGDEPTLSAHVDALLAFHGVSRIVLGHTVAPGVVLPRFGGKVVLNDVGMSPVYGGPQSSLEIRGGAVAVRHRRTLVPLPPSSDLKAYLAAVLALEPATSKLRTWVADGAVWPPPQPTVGH